MGKDSLTIKEFAEKAGCTVQAVYQRIEKDLKPYLKIENGKKRLDIKVLEKIEINNDSSNLTSSFKEVLKLLENQISEKDKQLAEKDRQLNDMNNRLAEVTTALIMAQQTAKDAQSLHAGTIQKQLMEGSEKQGWFSKHFRKEKNA